MPITVRIIATALVVLALGGSAAAQDVSRTGRGDMALTRQDVPRTVHTGLADMALTPVGFRSPAAPHRVATQTPDRSPWPLIIVSVLLTATVTGLHYRARRRRSAMAR